MTVKQVFYIFLQVVGMLTFVGAGVVGTLIYIGAQKKQSETVTIEKPVSLTPESEPELKELEPVSFSQPSSGEGLTKAKRKAKSRPASKAVKPVTYSAPKKVAPVEKPKTAATKKVAPTKTQIRRMAVKSAEPLHYGPSPETKERVQSILQFRATDNNVPTDNAARPATKEPLTIDLKNLKVERGVTWEGRKFDPETDAPNASKAVKSVANSGNKK